MTQCKLEGRRVLRIRTDRGGELSKCSEACDLLIKKHQCTLQTTAGYSSWLNGKVKSHNKTSVRMCMKTLFDSGLDKSLWCLTGEDSNKTNQSLYHDGAKDSPHALWYITCPHISEFRVWGCYIEAKIPPDLIKKQGKLAEQVEQGYYMGTSGTNSIIKYWDPASPKTIKVCTSAQFNDRVTYLPNGKMSPGSLMSGGEKQPADLVPIDLSISPNPILSHPVEVFCIDLPLKGQKLHLLLKQCQYNNLSYIVSSSPTSFWYKQLPVHL